MQFQSPCDQTQTNTSDIPRTGKHIIIRNILKKTIDFILLILKLQWNYSCNLFSILLNNGTFRYIKWNLYYGRKNKYIHLNRQMHTFYEKRILWNKGGSWPVFTETKSYCKYAGHCPFACSDIPSLASTFLHWH